MTTLAERQKIMMTAIQKLQNAMKPTISTGDIAYEPKRYQEVEDFEAFCLRLQEKKEFRDSYVRFIQRCMDD